MRSTLRIPLVIVCWVVAFSTVQPRGQAQSDRGQPPPIKVTLLGTAPGPPVRIGRAGISTLVEAGGERFLFDAGYGSLARLVESGLPMDAVTRLFLTHLHSAPSQQLFDAIVGHHTTPEQAADIFRRVSPRLALFSHAEGGDAVVERTRRTYPGRVEFGEDLMVIEIGDEVVVHRRGANTPR